MIVKTMNLSLNVGSSTHSPRQAAAPDFPRDPCTCTKLIDCRHGNTDCASCPSLAWGLVRFCLVWGVQCSSARVMIPLSLVGVVYIGAALSYLSFSSVVLPFFSFNVFVGLALVLCPAPFSLPTSFGSQTLLTATVHVRLGSLNGEWF